MTTITGNIKPQRGMQVRLKHRPSLWMCMDKSPQKPGAWWMLAVDDEAKASGDVYDCATYRDMQPNRGAA